MPDPLYFSNLLHGFSVLQIGTQLLVNLCVAASLLLATKWKSVDVPSKEEWLGKVRFLCLKSKLFALLKFRQRNGLAFEYFKKQWAGLFSITVEHGWIL